MKLMRLAMCVAVFALVGGIAISEDLDIRALQAKLAAQEARLNDLQAKMNSSKASGGEAAGVVSMRKNAVVTIGGQVNTRAFVHSGTVKSRLNDIAAPTAVVTNRKIADVQRTNLRVSDAKLRVQVDVNDYFDAYLQADLIDGDFNRAGVAQRYWVRWKNLCDSGFGVLVGRSDLVFGAGNSSGSIASGYYGAYDYMNDMSYGVGAAFGNGEGMFIGRRNMIATHTGWDYSRTTQVTPYWESKDGKFKAEVSLFQALDRAQGGAFNDTGPDDTYEKIRSINYGVGTFSTRFTWKPIEGLKLTGSVVNFRNELDNDITGHSANFNAALSGMDKSRIANNNTATNLHVEYVPAFFPKLKVWSTWTHGWNEGWIDNMDSDVFNFGFTYALTEQLSMFAQGDILRVTNDDTSVQVWHKNNAWASYIGLKYALPYGVDVEAGWRHEESKFKGRDIYSGTHTKAKMDTFYAHLGFQF